MRNLLEKYKSVIRFILTFILVYVVLSFGYKFYLDTSKNVLNHSDYITTLVGKQSESILNSLGYKAKMIPHPNEPSMKVLLNDKYVGRVIEGCNSISIIILFVSFIVAFSDTWKSTLLYVFVGGVLIYIVNLLRIVILSVGLYKYPEQEILLHTIIFPLIIYGMVFLLWVFWVNRLQVISKVKSE